MATRNRESGKSDKSDKERKNIKITLRNVRLSFPNIFRPQKFEDEKTGEVRTSWRASFLLDKKKDAEQIEKVRAAMKRVRSEEWGDKPPRFKEDQYCLRDGEPMNEDDEREALWEGYEGCMYVTASNSKRRPTVIDKDNEELLEEDGKPYAGCYVDAIITIYPYRGNAKKQIPSRINASLEGVRFRKDGDAFGSKGIDASEFGDPIDDDEFEDDEAPRRSSKKGRSRNDDDFDDDDDAPRRSSKSRRSRNDDDDDDDAPRRSSKSSRSRDDDDDDDDDTPRRSSKSRRSRDDDDDDLI